MILIFIVNVEPWWPKISKDSPVAAVGVSRFKIPRWSLFWSLVYSQIWIWLNLIVAKWIFRCFRNKQLNCWSSTAGFPPTTLNIMRCWTRCWYLWTCVLQISYQNNPKYGGRQKEKERIFFEGTQFGKKTNLPSWVMLTTLSATLSTSMSANMCTSMSAAMSSRCFVMSQGRWQDFKHIWAERFWRSPAWLSPLLKSFNKLLQGCLMKTLSDNEKPIYFSWSPKVWWQFCLRNHMRIADFYILSWM